MTFETNAIARRTFLKTLTVAGVVAAASPLIARNAFGDAGTYTSVGKLTSFKVGDFTRVALPDGTSLYVERDPADPSTVLALSSVCTHKGCPVLWEPAVKQFKCPCHGGVYDKDGGNVSGPPKKPLQKIASKVVNGDVQVSV